MCKCYKSTRPRPRLPLILPKALLVVLRRGGGGGGGGCIFTQEIFGKSRSVVNNNIKHPPTPL